MIATIKGVQKNEMPLITALVYRFGGKVIGRTVPLNQLGTDKGQVEVEISGEDEVNGFDIAVCDLGYDVKWDDEKESDKPKEVGIPGQWYTDDSKFNAQMVTDRAIIETLRNNKAPITSVDTFDDDHQLCLKLHTDSVTVTVWWCEWLLEPLLMKKKDIWDLLLDYIDSCEEG